ncbi:MAG: hypothetical protein OEM84_15335 [Acidimicrobiia bacterium]|nr:hypothetical protein [Acidimicrobiia bacterium]
MPDVVTIGITGNSLGWPPDTPVLTVDLLVRALSLVVRETSLFVAQLSSA